MDNTTGWANRDIDWLVEQAELAKELGDALPKALLERDRLRGLLARLEWAGTVVFDEWYDKGRCCPVCKAGPDDGHEADCWLAAELGR